MTSILSNDDVLMAVPAAAQRVARRYRGFIALDDLTQSGYLWAAEHPRKVKAELPDPEEPERQQRQAYARLVRLFERALEGVARAEKAAQSGYQGDDEFFYETGLIEELLPTVWNENAAVNPPQTDNEKVSPGAGDPREGNSWVVMVADIRAAWQQADLTTEDRAYLSLRYGSGLTIDAVATAMSVTKETAIRRLKAGLAELGRSLHGVRPLRIEHEEDE